MRDTIIDVQRRDHAALDRLMQTYRSESGARERRSTHRELVRLVTTHAFAEEEVLFPAARRLLAHGESMTREIESQHQRVNELLKELESHAPGEPAFETHIAELFPLLVADLRNEEDDLLPELARRLDRRQLERLGRAFEAAKHAAPTRGHPNIPRRPPGNVLAGIPLFFFDRMRDALARRRHAPP